jgi:hypothetical protein
VLLAAVDQPAGEAPDAGALATVLPWRRTLMRSPSTTTSTGEGQSPDALRRAGSG